ncbi:hypothetical protein F1C10_03955 [Sphingomonas sp. NBWT7]|nr:hypothetical protein F1C10_03955 [Sphingomonas sp. NBWT7]
MGFFAALAMVLTGLGVSVAAPTEAQAQSYRSDRGYDRDRGRRYSNQRRGYPSYRGNRGYRNYRNYRGSRGYRSYRRYDRPRYARAYRDYRGPRHHRAPRHYRRHR